MGAFRLAFDIRKGDYFSGDNQNFMHAQTEQINKCEDVDNITYVFYSREGMTKLESFENECCRGDFVKYAKANLADKYQKNSGGKFMGIYPGMFTSDEWLEFKENHCPDASNTNYWHSEN
jgi:hypothetical protein